jgi:hypothetical protein
MLTVFDSISLINTLEDSLSLVGIKSASCKLRAVCEIHNKDDVVQQLDSVAEVVMRMVEGLRKEKWENIGAGWLEAAAKGESGEGCWQEYPCDREGQGYSLSDVR